MEIEILVVPDCPHQQLVEKRLRQALDDAGRTATGFVARVITGQSEAEQSAFTGFPTILVDGRDPFTEPGITLSLSCRIYRTSDGPAGAPDVGQLRMALEASVNAPD